MKKLLLFLSFFVLTLFVNGQAWDAVKIGTIDTDSIRKGTVTIWVKPTTDSIDWTYDGVMTVGYDSYTELYGYNSKAGIGSINPETSDFVSVNWSAIDKTLSVQFGLFVTAITFDSLFIAGNIFVLEDVGNNTWEVSLTTNPFPAVGETCDIKLKYTLIKPCFTWESQSVTTNDTILQISATFTEGEDVNCTFWNYVISDDPDFNTVLLSRGDMGISGNTLTDEITWYPTLTDGYTYYLGIGIGCTADPECSVNYTPYEFTINRTP